jgi:nitrite reductase (NADH) small subunit
MQIIETVDDAGNALAPEHVTQDARVTWQRICSLDDIVPDTGVCALLGSAQVAVFRVTLPAGAMHVLASDVEVLAAAGEKTVGEADSGIAEALFAIGNVDPHSGASVLSRGVIGSVGERIVVASPLYKQHFDLRTGACLESPDHAVPTYRVALKDGAIWLAT